MKEIAGYVLGGVMFVVLLPTFAVTSARNTRRIVAVPVGFCRLPARNRLYKII